MVLVKCEYMKCPLCGRLDLLRGGLIPPKLRKLHAVEIRQQMFPGKSIIRWSRRSLSDEELAALLEIVESLARRLRNEQHLRKKEVA